jgi:hypothetical protein
MKKIVLVNVDFRDVYTGELHMAGTKCEMTDARIAEVKAVNPEFVSVIGSVAEPEQADATEPVVEPVAEPEQKPKRAAKKAE